MINTINHSINIDLANKINIINNFQIKKNDTNSHKFMINIFNNSVAYDLTGLAAKIYLAKLDNTIVFQDCVLDDAINGKISSLLTTQALSCTGIVQAEITIYGTNSEILTSITFNFNVVATVRDDTAIESSSEFTALTTALTTVNLFNSRITATETELQNARGGKVNLDARLDDHDSQLADYANLNNYPRIVPEVDDTGRLQRAIDSGKNVIVPEGTYNHTTLNFMNNTRLIGRGDSVVLKNLNNTSSIKIASAEAIMSTLVQNIKMLGNPTKPNNHAIEFVGVNSAYCVIDRVFIQSFGGHGIYGGHVGHVNNVEIKGCFIRGCTGDGINMEYGLGQINAIWIHHNNVVGNNNGILFYGNNVVVESNSVQANRGYAFALSNQTLNTTKNCFGSAIRHNYTEGNASAVVSGASIIGIFSCYVNDGSTNNKSIRGLDISDNFFVESGAKYNSVIYLADLKTSSSSSKNCTLSTSNNQAELKLLTYNKSTALSEGCVIDERYYALIPTSMTLALPSWVEVRGLGKYQSYNNCRWMKSVNLPNSPHKGKKFVVTLYSTNPSFNNSETFGRSILNVKVTGMYDFGSTTRFTTDCTYHEPAKFCTPVVVNLGAGATGTPTVSQITRVAFTNGDGFQFTVTPSTAGMYAAFLDLTCFVETEFKYLDINVAEVAL